MHSKHYFDEFHTDFMQYLKFQFKLFLQFYCQHQQILKILRSMKVIDIKSGILSLLLTISLLLPEISSENITFEFTYPFHVFKIEAYQGDKIYGAISCSTGAKIEVCLLIQGQDLFSDECKAFFTSDVFSFQYDASNTSIYYLRVDPADYGTGDNISYFVSTSTTSSPDWKQYSGVLRKGKQQTYFFNQELKAGLNYQLSYQKRAALQASSGPFTQVGKFPFDQIKWITKFISPSDLIKQVTNINGNQACIVDAVAQAGVYGVEIATSPLTLIGGVLGLAGLVGNLASALKCHEIMTEAAMWVLLSVFIAGAQILSDDGKRGVKRSKHY